MEQQVTEILETLKTGLQELPAVGSQAFELLVSGKRIEAIGNLMINIIILLLILFILKKIVRVTKREIGNRRQGVLFLAEDGFFLSIGIVGITIVGLFVLILIPDNITQIVTPEYAIVNQLIDSLN